MRVLVAGATGALGRPLVRMLVARGHEVVGLTRRPEGRESLERLGAQGLVADALDARALERAVREAGPSHVVHLLTALPAAGPLRARDLRATNVLRVRGTANLVGAAQAAGARRFVAESFLGVYGPLELDEPRGEDDPLPEVGVSTPFRESILALRSLEEQLAGARRAGRLESVALRFGAIYGPEVGSTLALVERLRRRQVFLPRSARGVTSFVHVDDAAGATLAALEAPAPGAVYNVVDDEPLSLAAYLASAATAFGAPAPRVLPAWILRLVAPLIAAAAFTRLPLSNAKARRELGWRPVYPSPRQGIPEVARALALDAGAGR